MKRTAEIFIFGSLAIGMHIAGFYTIPAKGVQAGGSGGVEAVSILGANPQIETIVAEWEKAPATMETLDIKQIKPPTLDHELSINIPNSQITAIKLPSVMAPAEPKADEAINVRTETAKPIPKPKLKPEPKPKVSKKGVVKKTPQKAKKTQPPSDNHKQQKSAGTGGSVFAGKGQSTVTTGVTKKQIADMRQVWAAKIKRRIERTKKYPRGTRKNGKVLIKLTIGKTGSLIGYSLRKTSGTSALDTAALQAISNVNKFPAAPKGLKHKSYTFNVPIVFKR